MSQMSSNNPLQPQIKHIFDNAKSAIFRIECYFVNINNENLQMKIEYLNQIDIFHDFINSCMENIEIEFECDVIQYQTLMKWYNELKCFIRLIFYDDIKMEDKEEYFRCSYRALIQNLQDVRQILPQSELYDKDDPDKDLSPMKRGERVKMKVQLMKEEAYTLSKIKISNVLHDATVEQAILTFIEAVKVKKFCMVPPDNKTKYKNLKIPPLKDVSNIFSHLHTTYGIYEKYGNVYFHDNCLFIFPCFTIEGKSVETFHVYKAPPGYLLGSKGTTIIEDGDIFMFSNQISSHKITAVKELESVGNSYYSFNTKKLVDGWAKHTESGSLVEDDNSDIYNANFSKGAVEQTHVPKFEINKNNEYLLKSKLAALGVSVLEIGWSASLPFLIQPFQKIKYHYEHKEQQKTISATCPIVTYALRRVTRLHQPIFACSASLKLFVNNGTESLD